ncbi:hypothetical protein BD626DRAFT_264916 [Schizophyllum amplum]|uniref:Uncharacterized protein n=1 Tax=Schizophyllum amplum TaxID=97359 RepID=A0A550CGX7_9AGAR|nr:hypothetical protein BD626DRAFT_264916 [Auriculariopsis ampla]
MRRVDPWALLSHEISVQYRGRFPREPRKSSAPIRALQSISSDDASGHWLAYQRLSDLSKFRWLEHPDEGCIQEVQDTREYLDTRRGAIDSKLSHRHARLYATQRRACPHWHADIDSLRRYLPYRRTRIRQLTRRLVIFLPFPTHSSEVSTSASRASDGDHGRSQVS